MPTILGLHSNATTGDPDAGHAWLTVKRGGTITSYGLWPDDHEDTVDNGSASDIRMDLELFDEAEVSRYYRLTVAQATKLELELRRDVSWWYTDNCASWASDVVRRVVGEDVDADDLRALGVESPVKLGQSIKALEAKDPTSTACPAQFKPARSSSSAARRVEN